jgi:hypothetical protein
MGWGYPLIFVVIGLVFVVSTALAVWKLPASRTGEGKSKKLFNNSILG